MDIYEFNERLEFSRGVREATDVDTLLQMVDGAVDCKKTEKASDLGGIDYRVTLDGGAVVNVDAKTRDYNKRRPAHRYWQGEPDLALEVWSVHPVTNGAKGPRKPGWTFNKKSNVDLILFTYDPRLTRETFLVGFQHLRMAAVKNYRSWRQRFPPKPQFTVRGSEKWRSWCMFVPVSVVLDAIVDVSRYLWEPGSDRPRQREFPFLHKEAP